VAGEKAPITFDQDIGSDVKNFEKANDWVNPQYGERYSQADLVDCSGVTFSMMKAPLDHALPCHTDGIER
jgi:hypothetical protein